MTSFIIVVVIALFIVSVGFTWYRLEAYEGIEKVVIAAIGVIICWVVTSVLFDIAAKGIKFPSIEAKEEMSRILVLIFTPINMLILMPYTAKQMSKLKFEEIGTSELVKNLLIFAVIIIVLFFFELKYLNYIQEGIINIANKV